MAILISQRVAGCTYFKPVLPTDSDEDPIFSMSGIVAMSIGIIVNDTVHFRKGRRGSKTLEELLDEEEAAAGQL